MSENKEFDESNKKNNNEQFNKPDGYKNINSSSEINLNGYKYNEKTKTLVPN